MTPGCTAATSSARVFARPPTPPLSLPATPASQVEDVLNVIEKERPEGIIVQFGGQTPLKLATALQKALEDNPIPAASGEGGRLAPLPACLLGVVVGLLPSCLHSV